MGLDHAGLRPQFHWVLSVDAVKIYKPSPKVYQLALRAMRLPKQRILFVSSNAFDVVGRRASGSRSAGSIAPGSRSILWGRSRISW